MNRISYLYGLRQRKTRVATKERFAVKVLLVHLQIARDAAASM